MNIVLPVRTSLFSVTSSSHAVKKKFVTEFKKLSQDCEFGELCNSLIRDVIIMGLLDNKLRERLLRELDLTLENVVKYGQAAEETKQHVRVLQRQLESEKKSIRCSKA